MEPVSSAMHSWRYDVQHTDRRCLAAAPALLSNAEPPQPTTSVLHVGRSSRVAHGCGVDPAEVVDIFRLSSI